MVHLAHMINTNSGIINTAQDLGTKHETYFIGRSWRQTMLRAEYKTELSWYNIPELLCVKCYAL